MIRWLFLSFTLVIAHFVTAQSSKPYEVIAVKGKVRAATTHRLLQTGFRIARQDSFLFSTSDALFVAIDRQQRCFVVKQADRYKEPAQWKAFDGVIGNRNGRLLSLIEFQAFLSGRTWLILGGEAALEVGHEAFPLDEQHFFYVRYRWSGDTTAPVNKRLPQQGQTIFFKASDLFRVDGRPIAPETASLFALFYYDAATQTSLEISPFDPVFPDPTALEAEYKTLAAHYNATPEQQAELKKAVLDYLTTIYGMPEKANFEAWLSTQSSRK